jgi:DNA ligase D-like protein (predicted ligase)
MGPFDKLSADARQRLRQADHPQWVGPMLATLTDRRFSDPSWLFERKLDGQRALAFRSGDNVQLLSRNKLRLDRTYPEVVDALLAQSSPDYVLDGEIVAFEGTRTSFSRLQQRIGISDEVVARRSPVVVRYYVFDLLHLDGYDTTALTLRQRKQLLRRAVEFNAPLHFTAHRDGASGEEFYAQACAKGWEGVMAKRADSRYVSRRSDAWLKLKCTASQEFVVGGFTEGTGSRTGFGALLLGYYEERELVYAGKVGTGFSQAELTSIRNKLDELRVDASPFRRGRITEPRVRWVRPELVAEIVFGEWTPDGRLRHPRFEGLRTDKDAAEVVRESPGGVRRR